MDNIIEFGKKPKAKNNSDHMFTLDLYMNTDGEYEVYMEVDDIFDSSEVFEAMIAAAMKYAVDHDIPEADIEPEPANIP